jgi:hypothetical protein
MQGFFLCKCTSVYAVFMQDCHFFKFAICMKSVDDTNYDYYSNLSKYHHLMAAILGFDAILNFLPMLLKHFSKKLIFLTYNVNLYYFLVINIFILTCPVYILLLAAILDFGGHLGFLKSGSQTEIT